MACSKPLIIRITNKTIIKASDVSLQPYILPVSNLDLMPSHVPTAFIFIYPKPTHTNVDFIATTIKAHLPSFLNHFFPLAGRISKNETTGRPEVTCDNKGAEFVEAHANIPISGLDLSNTEKSAGGIILPMEGKTLMSLQLVQFACGNYALTWCYNHLLVEAYSGCSVVCSWSEFIRTGKILEGPNFDRLILRPRFPPEYSSSVDHSYISCSPDGLKRYLLKEPYQGGFYYVSAPDLVRLVNLAKRNGRKVTRTEAFSAHVWKIMAEVVGKSSTACQMAWIVSGRRMMGKAHRDDMARYIGNMFSFAAREASVQAIKMSLLSDVAGMVADAIDEVANESHFRDLIDWIDHQDNINKNIFHRAELGLNSATLIISSFHSVRLDTDFGFGKAAIPFYHMPGQCTMPAGFMTLGPSLNGDGSWMVNAALWPELASALQSNPLCPLKPLTREYVEGLMLESRSNQNLISRI